MPSASRAGLSWQRAGNHVTSLQRIIRMAEILGDGDPAGLAITGTARCNRVQSVNNIKFYRLLI